MRSQRRLSVANADVTDQRDGRGWVEPNLLFLDWRGFIFVRFVFLFSGRGWQWWFLCQRRRRRRRIDSEEHCRQRSRERYLVYSWHWAQVLPPFHPSPTILDSRSPVCNPYIILDLCDFHPPIVPCVPWHSPPLPRNTKNRRVHPAHWHRIPATDAEYKYNLSTITLKKIVKLWCHHDRIILQEFLIDIRKRKFHN